MKMINREPIRFEGKDSVNPFAFKYYDANRIVAGKTMKKQLKFAMSYWHSSISNDVKKDSPRRLSF